MSRKAEVPKMSIRAQEINRLLDEDEKNKPVRVLPDVLIRQPTQIEKDRQKIAIRVVDC